MEFDITHLDKRLLIQSLFAHAGPLNLGKVEYFTRKKWGENVEGLTDEECEIILYDFNQLDSGSLRIIDYHKGKPMKLVFDKKRNGRELVDSDSYDEHNGKFRFFEAMLDIFSVDEIFITKKGFGQFAFINIPEHLKRTKEQASIFKKLLRNTVERKNSFGKYWIIDENKVKYTPPFLQSFLE